MAKCESWSAEDDAILDAAFVAAEAVAYSSGLAAVCATQAERRHARPTSPARTRRQQAICT